MRDVTGSGTFGTVKTFTSATLQTTLTTASDGLVDGRVYEFRWYAANDYGNGEYSDEI